MAPVARGTAEIRGVRPRRGMLVSNSATGYSAATVPVSNCGVKLAICGSVRGRGGGSVIVEEGG
jgi:hypothetical protein